jgi:hypothetical protein
VGPPLGPVRYCEHTVLNCAIAAIAAFRLLTLPARPLTWLVLALPRLAAWALLTARWSWRIWACAVPR